MFLTSKLKIILITYNRANRLRETFEQILCESSPIRDLSITVFDNNSTDETRQVVAGYQQRHPNLSYRKNNLNVGGNANICKALEAVDSEYHWVLCDDDVYDLSGWNDIEQAMERGEKLILASNGFLSVDPARFTSKAHQLLQMSFLPTIIYHRDLLTETAIRNSYDNLFALFPHIAPVVMHFNNGGSAYVAPKGVVFAGGKPGDASFSRGSVKSELFHRSSSMSMAAGIANLVANLNDRKLARECFSLLTKSEWMGGPVVFYGGIFYNLRETKSSMNYHDIWSQAPLGMKCALFLMRLVQKSPLYYLIANERLYRFLRNLIDRTVAKRQKKAAERTATAN